MEELKIGQIREWTKLSNPSADFDKSYTFYYDETNNIKKFHIKNKEFNVPFTSNFILGGLVHEGTAPNIQPLFEKLNLQSSVKEVKFKHIAKGNFLECLESEKLRLFLKFIIESDLYIHYSSLNILYWSLVDIVDSAIANLDIDQQVVPMLSDHVKNDLYKLARTEINNVIYLFYKYAYPNLKTQSIIPFIDELITLFYDYIDDMELHLGLESLRQILKESKKQNSMPFITENENFILIDNFLHFYIRPVYLFKNSTHIFDNEDSIKETFDEYKIMDGKAEVKNYSFIDSESNLYIQLSDVFVGLMGKLTSYININSRDNIYSDVKTLSSNQHANILLLIGLIDKSNNKNIAFLHAVDCFEELSKMNIIRENLQ